MAIRKQIPWMTAAAAAAAGVLVFWLAFAGGPEEEPQALLTPEGAAPAASGAAREEGGAPAPAAPDREDLEPGDLPDLPLSGTIRNRAGEPLPGARITIIRPGPGGIGGQIIAEFRAGAEGRYALRVPKRMALVIEARAPGYLRARREVGEWGGKGQDLMLDVDESYDPDDWPEDDERP